MAERHHSRREHLGEHLGEREERAPKTRKPRAFGPRALARHEAMRMLYAKGYKLGDVSRIASTVVRLMEQNRMPITRIATAVDEACRLHHHGGGR